MWYYVIPYWFHLLMLGRVSNISNDSYWNSVQTKYGYYVVDSFANNASQFKRQIDSARAIQPDSFKLVQLSETDFVQIGIKH